jgi:acyl-CoA reductase-like NAD-dependent aldehyde dehydrogenase
LAAPTGWRAGSGRAPWVNTLGGLDPTLPFGGYKESGVGRESGPDWYHAYTENKAVYISL